MWGGGKLNATSILLEPLRDAAVNALIQNLLGEGEVPEQVRDTLRRAGEGNPLFVEEMLAMLLDEGRLRRGDGDRWNTVGDLSEIETPATIQALLAARIDRLSDDERDLLERASIVGRLFSREAMGGLSSDGATLDKLLGALVRKDLIRPDRTAEDAFRFRHLLIRDAAYLGIAKEGPSTSCTSATPSGWSRSGGAAPRVRGSPRLPPRAGPPVPRRAFSIGRSYSGPCARAADLLSSAGRRASARGDVPAAVGLLTRAYALLGDDEPRRLALASDLGAALRDTGELTRADLVLSRAIDEAKAAGDRRTESLALIEFAFLRLQTDPGRTEEVLGSAERAVAVFRELEDELGLSKAWSLVANVHWIRCRFGRWKRCGAGARACREGR